MFRCQMKTQSSWRRACQIVLSEKELREADKEADRVEIAASFDSCM